MLMQRLNPDYTCIAGYEASAQAEIETRAQEEVKRKADERGTVEQLHANAMAKQATQGVAYGKLCAGPSPFRASFFYGLICFGPPCA